MTPRMDTVFLELERTRSLVVAANSIDDLHRAVDQSMRHALASSKENPALENAEGKYQETSLDGLIETLANICITLLDSHEIPRERLLKLVDTALAQGNTDSPCPRH